MSGEPSERQYTPVSRILVGLALVTVIANVALLSYVGYMVGTTGDLDVVRAIAPYGIGLAVAGAPLGIIGGILSPRPGRG
ncbi:MAG: hypothetical protein AAB955_02500 [Patescibacteria group bacterium]